MKTGKCYVCGIDNLDLCLNGKCKRCMSDYKRLWYEKNKCAIRSKQEVYRAENFERLKSADKLWRENNREKDAARVRDWAKNNPDRRAESQRRRRARKFGTQIFPITLAMLAERLEVFGNKCAYCGGPFEHWDHLKPLELGGPHMLSNMRPSCAKCNIRKGCMSHKLWMQKLTSHRSNCVHGL